MNAPEEIIGRIRKCLALANGKNATPGEMEAAMGKAKEIAMRYNIEIASINMDSGKSASAGIEIQRTDVGIRSKKEQGYHRWIVTTLQECFGLRIIRMSSRGGYGVSFVFIGEKTDVAIGQVLFPWLEDVFYTTYYTAKKEGQVISCAAHKNGRYRGLCFGICAVNKRVEEELAKKDAQCFAMVVRDKKALVDQRTENEFPDLKKRKSNQSADANAFMLGVQKGKSIKLNQLGGGEARPQLS